MRGVLIACATLFAIAAPATRTDYVSAQKKFQAIDKRQVQPGSRVTISSEELNAYVETELPKVAPSGIRQPHVELHGNNTASGSAMIDFLKLRSARGKSSSWLTRKLFEGEREVKVTTRIVSSAGKVTVNLQQAEVAGIPISGGALDFLVSNYLIPNYPQAKIGRPFAIHPRVDRLEVGSGEAYVFIKR